MKTLEYNKLFRLVAGVHSPFHTPTGSATWDVKQSRACTAILAAESRTHNVGMSHQCLFLSSVNLVANKNAFYPILAFILEHTVPDTHKFPLDARIRIASHAHIRIACAHSTHRMRGNASISHRMRGNARICQHFRAYAHIRIACAKMRAYACISIACA